MCRFNNIKMGNIEYFNTDAHVYKLNSWITKCLLEVPVFVHFNILGKLERGIHGEAMPSHVYLSKTSLIY